MALQVGEIFAKIRLDLSEFKTGIATAQQQMQNMSNNVDKTSKSMDGFGHSAHNAQGGIIGLYGAMLKFSAIMASITVGFNLLKDSVDFSAQMTKVKVISEATTEEIDKLTQSALQIAPAMGFSANQAAEALKQLAASGFSAAQMSQMLPAVMSAATASGEDLALAAEVVSSQLHSFNMTAADSGHIADVLAKAANISAISLSDMSYSLKYAGPVAHAVGISFEEVSAALAIMGNSGIKAEQAGTTLRAVMERLVNPTKEAKEVMSALGINVKDASGNLLPFADIVGTLQTHLANATQAQKAQALAMIFGTEATSGMLAMLSAGPDKLKEFTKELENSTGSSKKAAQEMQDNFEGSLKKLWGTISATAIIIEQTLEPSLKSVADSLNKFFSSFKNSDGFKDSLKGFAQDVATVFKFLIENSDKVILAIKAIAGAFVAMKIVAILNIESIGKALKTLQLLLLSTRGWVGIAAAAFVLLEDSASKNLYGIGDKQRALGVFFVQSWKLMVDNALIIWYGFCQLVNQAANGIFSVINGIGKAFGAAGDLINTSWIDEQKTHLQGLIAESDKLGVSVSEAGSKVAEAFSTWKTPGDPNADFQSIDADSYNTKADAVTGLGDAFKGLGSSADVAIPQVSGLGSMLDDIGSKSKKASDGAKDSREEWEKLADGLQSALRVIQAQWQMTTIEMGMNADATNKLESELSSLNDQYYLQAQIVDNARQAYETMLATKGIDSKDTADAADAYAKEAKTLADMKNRMDEINYTLKAHAELVDKIKSDIEDLNTAHQIELANLTAEATKVDELRLKQRQLNEDLAKQTDLVNTLSSEYAAAVEMKGKDSEETNKLHKELQQAQLKEAEIRKDVRDTNKSFKDQADGVRDLESKLTDLNAKYDEVIKKQKDDLATALDDYQKKVSDTNQKLSDDEKKLNDDFKKTLDDRAKSLRDFVGLFDSVQPKQVSGQTLLDNLKGQVSAFEDWQSNIKALATKGVDEGLIAELKDMGPKAGAEIAALNTLSDTQLQEYVALWKQKSTDARTEANAELDQQRIDTQQKIMDLRIQASQQLEQYRQDWEKKNAEIRANTKKEIDEINKSYKDITEKATGYGVSLMTNFIDGARSKFADLQKMLSDTVDTISSYMSQVGINMPSVNMPSLATVGSSVSNSSSLSQTINNLGGITIQGGGSASDQADQLIRELRKRGVRI